MKAKYPERGGLSSESGQRAVGVRPDFWSLSLPLTLKRPETWSGPDGSDGSDRMCRAIASCRTSGAPRSRAPPP